MFLPGFALLLQNCSLLFLQGLKAGCQPTRLFVGVVLVLLEVSFKFCQELGIIGGAAEIPHGEGRSTQRDEVIEVQAGAILVEHEEEHEGHEVHHILHHLHLRCLFGRRSGHRLTLLAHTHHGVKKIGQTEEDAEEREMVAQAPNTGTPRDEVVVG